jgi:signal transduction histidine kinase/DNA-binding response OmpR family regulator/HAMP domain-containing protein
LLASVLSAFKITSVQINIEIMKLENLKIGTQLRIGLGAMMLLVAVLGFISYEQTNNIARQTETMYNHPLHVRRALGELKFDITAIHREMKDLFLPESDIRMPVTINNIELFKSSAFERIDILYAWYLGPRTDIDSLKQNFITWNSLREETIRLLKEGKTTEAALRTYSEDGIAGMQVEVLYRSLDKIDMFARNKADLLHNTSQELNRTLNNQLMILIAAFLIILLLVSIFLIRAVKLPINELSMAAVRFRDGDLSARSANTSKNEFGGLAASFNSLVNTIQANTDISNKVVALTGKMLSEDDAKNFFQSTLQIMMDQTGSQMAAAYLLSDDKKHFEHFESIGIDDDAKKSFSASGHEGEFGAAVTTQRIQHLKNIPETTRFLYNTVKGKFIPNEIITIPIVSGGEVIAIISLASVGVYKQASIQLIETIHITYAARIEGILAYRRIKEISARLEEQNRELELQQRELTAQSSELTEQNRELEVQKNQLSEANKLKTSFLSNMSHELRTPLNSVIALSGVLSRRLAKQIPDEELSYLEVIERNGKNLLSLINDVLDISRIESGMEEVEPTQFDLCAAIDDVASMIQPQAAEKNLYLKNAAGDCKVQIITDASKFRHILQNLISNAVKFTEKGGVDISVKKLDDKVAIVVADTGIGISAEHLPHIFDEFRQADSGVSRRFGGTGLGLAIAKKYANLLGGSILVRSVQGEGSDFTLTLPIVYDENNQITENDPEGNTTKTIPKPKISTMPGGAKTVMLIEDSEPAVIQIKDFLEENGYNVVVGKDGAEALELFNTVIPDAIILDLMMPGIDGFQVLQSIRDADITAHIPVLILTAKYITRDDLQFLKRNNVYQLIQKGDIKRHELVKVVGEMIVGKTEEVAKPDIEKKPITGKPKVLVVEDNPDNMITVKAILADGYTVIEATNGREGVEKAKEHLPDLILMDIALPEMDGIQAFKAIRSDGRLQHTPVIALTASALKEDRELVLAHGFNAFIAKPIDESIFFNTINETLYEK